MDSEQRIGRRAAFRELSVRALGAMGIGVQGETVFNARSDDPNTTPFDKRIKKLVADHTPEPDPTVPDTASYYSVSAACSKYEGNLRCEFDDYGPVHYNPNLIDVPPDSV